MNGILSDGISACVKVKVHFATSNCWISELVLPHKMLTLTSRHQSSLIVGAGSNYL